MSENLISETISNAFKKTKLFEKMTSLQLYIGTFAIITSIIGITNIYMNYSNTLLMKNSIKNDDTTKIINQLNSNHDELVQLLQKKVEILETKLVVLFNSQHNILIEIKNLPALNIEKKFSVSTGTCFTPPNTTSKTVSKKGCDTIDELTDECYDNMPLSNVKKNIGMNWFII